MNRYYEVNLTTEVVTSSYYLGGRLVAQKAGSTLRHVHQDSLSSTALMSDSGGSLDSSMTFYPFGGTRSGSVNTEQRFTGQRLDAGTGLYYYGARYYDPLIGRFISADTVVQGFTNPQTLNRYSYCVNNPLKYVDSSGHVRKAIGVYADQDIIQDPPWPPPIKITFSVTLTQRNHSGLIAGFGQTDLGLPLVNYDVKGTVQIRYTEQGVQVSVSASVQADYVFANPEIPEAQVRLNKPNLSWETSEGVEHSLDISTQAVWEATPPPNVSRIYWSVTSPNISGPSDCSEMNIKLSMLILPYRYGSDVLSNYMDPSGFRINLKTGQLEILK